MIKDSKEHLNSVNETYIQHFKIAFNIGVIMVVGGFHAIFHAIYPSVFKTSASDKIKKLYEMKGWKFQEQKLDVNFTRPQFWEEFGRSATFPQLIVDGKRTGGCNETITQFRSQGLL